MFAYPYTYFPSKPLRRKELGRTWRLAQLTRLVEIPLEKAGVACCGAGIALKIAVLARSGAAIALEKPIRAHFSAASAHSKRLFAPAVRDHSSKVLVSVALCSEPLYSALLCS